LAEAIPKSWLAVVGGRAAVGSYGTSLPLFSFRRPKGSKFLNRAQANPIGLAEGPVDGPGLGHPHLGPADDGRDIGRIGIPIAHETLGLGRLVDGGLEDPAPHGWIAELAERLSADTGATMAASKAEEASVGYVPIAVEQSKVTQPDGECECCGKLPQAVEEWLGAPQGPKPPRAG
jgi:hypothetical protein